MWEIDWHIVQRMLIDAPRYDYDEKDTKKSKKPTQVINLSEESSEELIKKLLNNE